MKLRRLIITAINLRAAEANLMYAETAEYDECDYYYAGHPEEEVLACYC